MASASNNQHTEGKNAVFANIRLQTLFICFISLASCGQNSPYLIDLYQENKILSDTRQDLLSFGIPLSKGTVMGDSPLVYLLNSQGQKHQIDGDVLARWQDKQQSVKWLKVSYIAKQFNQATVPLSLHIVSDRLQAIKPRSACDRKGLASCPTRLIQVDNGHYRIAVQSKPGIQNQHLFQSFRFCPVKNDESSCMELDSPTLYLSTASQAYFGYVTRAALEENGLEHAILKLSGDYLQQHDQTKKMHSFVLRLYFGLGLNSLKIEHTLIFSSPEVQQQMLNSVSMRLPMPEHFTHVLSDVSGQVKLAAAKPDARLLIRQKDANADGHTDALYVEEGPEFVLNINGEMQTKETALGFLSAQNQQLRAGIAFQNSANEFPLGIKLTPEAKGHRFDIEFWPEDASVPSLDLRNPYGTFNPPQDVPTHAYCFGANGEQTTQKPYQINIKFTTPILQRCEKCDKINLEHFSNKKSRRIFATAPCLDYAALSSCQRQCVVNGLRPTWSYDLSGLKDDNEQTNFWDFVTRCHHAADCEPNRILLDLDSRYAASAQGSAKTRVFELIMEKPEPDQPSIIHERSVYLDDESFVRVSPEQFLQSGIFDLHQWKKTGRPVDSLAHNLPNIDKNDNWSVACINSAEFNTQLRADCLLRELLDKRDQERLDNRLQGALQYGALINQHASVRNLTQKEACADGTGADCPNLPYYSSSFYQQKARGYFNQAAHDILLSSWWIYLRHGDRQSYQQALRQSRYMKDLLMVWQHDKAKFIGLQKRHSKLPWIDPDLSHTLNGGMFLYHYITGDRRAEQAALLMAEAALFDQTQSGLFGRVQPDKVLIKTGANKGLTQRCTSPRDHSAPWLNLINAYAHSAEQKYKTAAELTLVALRGQQQLRGDGGINPRICNGFDGQGQLIAGSSAQQALPLAPVTKLQSFTAAVEAYLRNPGLAHGELVSAMAFDWAKFALRNYASLSPSEDVAMFPAMLAYAYFFDNAHPNKNKEINNAHYLALYPLIMEKITRQRKSFTAPYHLPRTIGYYQAAIDDFLAKGHSLQKIELR